MVISLLKVFARIGVHIFRRGRGIFKILFVIDDFIRVFTMTFLFIILLTWLNLPTFIIFLGSMLGLVIDMHDFISDHELAKFFD